MHVHRVSASATKSDRVASDVVQDESQVLRDRDNPLYKLLIPASFLSRQQVHRRSWKLPATHQGQSDHTNVLTSVDHVDSSRVARDPQAAR